MLAGQPLLHRLNTALGIGGASPTTPTSASPAAAALSAAPGAGAGAGVVSLSAGTAMGVGMGMGMGLGGGIGSLHASRFAPHPPLPNLGRSAPAAAVGGLARPLVQSPSSSAGSPTSTSVPVVEGDFISTGSLLWNPVNSLIRSISSLFLGTSALAPLSPVLTPTAQQRALHNRNQKHRKRQVLQSAEFYGVDFGPPPSMPEEDDVFVARRSLATLEQAQQEEKLRKEQGSVFISAINSMITSRAFGGSMSPLPERRPGDDDDDEGAPARDSFAIRHQGDASARSSVRDPARVSVHALDPVAPLKPDDPLSQSSGAKWVHPAQQHAQQLDYSDVFPSHVGHEPGISVFRIEALSPAIISPLEHGKFCVADCYIVLSARASATGGDNLEHHIYTWIGGDAEMDKKFCAAMFSVGLRNWIGAACRIEREAEGEESEEFLSLFRNEIDYEDISQATESGLFMAEQKRYPLRLYRMHGKADFRMCMVQPAYWSLASDGVFLLDWGLEIFQWNGSKSSQQHRVKCRMICERINKLERVGRAHVVEVDEWDEPPRLWEILGGERTREDAEAEGQKPNEDDPESVLERHFSQLSRAPPTLYRAFPKMAPELESHIVAVGKLKRSVLFSDGCYILDAGVELFLWIGKNAWPQLRSMATELLAKVVSSQKRPKWVGLNRCIDEHEPEIFKLSFGDWDGAKLDSVNWREVMLSGGKGDLAGAPAGVAAAKTPAGPNGKPGAAATASKIRVDVKALYAPPPNLDFNSLLIEDTIEHANKLLQAFTCFVYNRGRFVQLPEGERGLFFTNDAYVFLCVYRVEAREQLADKLAARRMSTPRRGSNRPSHSKRPSVASSGNGESIVSRHSQGSAFDRLRGADGDADGDAGGSSAAGSAVGSAVDSSNNVGGSSGNPDAESESDVFDDDYYEDDEAARSATASAPAAVLECVVYFWQGRHASRLAYSTFKLKTQHEMEHLVEQMYHSPVRVVHLEQGKEPIALLSHLDNMCVLRSGSRTDWLMRMEAKAAAAASGGSDSAAGALLRTSVQGAGKSPCAMFHIRSDLRYKTTRAIQVTAAAASLVSRDSFFVQSLDPARARHYLWIGKGVSKDEARRARMVADMLLSFDSQYDVTVRSDAARDSVLGDDIDRRSVYERDGVESIAGDRRASVAESVASAVQPRLAGGLGATALYDVIAEKLEPQAFWALIPGGRGVYAAGSESHTNRPPRFLRCSCSQGYFLVEEINFFSQIDCTPDTCVILDPGAPHTMFVWTGAEASDVVCKLTRKSVEVWLDHLDDGRVAVFDGGRQVQTASSAESLQAAVRAALHAAAAPLSRHASLGRQRLAHGPTIKSRINHIVNPPSHTATTRDDVWWVYQGSEPIEFRAFFHGWDESTNAIDPGNLFLREQRQNRIARNATPAPNGHASAGAAPA